MMLGKRLARSMSLTDVLARDTTADVLGLHNGASPSNTVGSQFWCLVGARESYARAIENGCWSGFRCSLGKDGAHDPHRVREALSSSGGAVLETVGRHEATGLSEAQADLAFDLLEHEAQHHGQLIRYFYAHRLEFPQAFAARYALK